MEMLSQVVNRPYLRTPQDQLQEIARNVDHVCEEYLHEMKEVARAAAHHSLVIFQKKKEDPPRPMNPEPPPNTTYVYITRGMQCIFGEPSEQFNILRVFCIVYSRILRYVQCP